MRAIDPARSRIVLLGTPSYQDKQLADVPQVAANLADLTKVFTDPQLGGLPEPNCVTASHAAGMEDIGDLLHEAAEQAEDLLLFYYAGHGVLGRRLGELYLSLRDTRFLTPEYSALRYETVRDTFLESKAVNRVVIVDSCYSGRAIGPTLGPDGQEVLGQLEIRGTYTLTSAPPNSPALVRDGEEHTAFTGRLLRLLNEGIPGGPAMLSLGDIYQHLHARLRADGLPLPQHRGTETADLLGLVRNRQHAAPRPDPAGSPRGADRQLKEEDLNRRLAEAEAGRIEAEAATLRYVAEAGERERALRAEMAERYRELERLVGKERSSPPLVNEQHQLQDAIQDAKARADQAATAHKAAAAEAAAASQVTAKPEAVPAAPPLAPPEPLNVTAAVDPPLEPSAHVSDSSQGPPGTSQAQATAGKTEPPVKDSRRREPGQGPAGGMTPSAQEATSRSGPSPADTGQAESPGPLHVKIRQKQYRLEPSATATYSIGRDPGSYIRVKDARTNLAHATLSVRDGTWVLEDPGSTNGTWVGTNRITRLPVTAPCSARLGNADDGQLLHLDPSHVPARKITGADSARVGNADDGQALRLGPGHLTARQPTDRPEHGARGGRPAAPASYGYRPPPGHLQGNAWSEWDDQPQFQAKVLTIGSGLDCDVVVDDPGVSPVHAKLQSVPNGRYELVALGNPSGTFVNGERIRRKTLAAATDIVSIGRSSFVLRGGQLVRRASERDISLTASGLFRPGGKRGTGLPLDVCFSVPGNCLLAISGPAGAGKTTLLSALAGNCPPAEGMVLYGNRNLYEDYEELKGLIGFVPQQSLLVTLGGIRHRGLTRLTAPWVHRFARLTARDALAYVMEARFPAAAKRERGQLVYEVLDQVSMAHHAGTLLEGLSPEQEKRLAIGLELVTRRALLLLDEPTRQLDAHGKRELFQLMREVAITGPAVVLATGDVEPELLGLCDLMLLLAPGGKMAYLGPPGEAPSYFGRPALAEVFADLNEKPEFDWDVRYKRSPHYQKYVTETKWRAGAARTH